MTASIVKSNFIPCFNHSHHQTCASWKEKNCPFYFQRNCHFPVISGFHFPWDFSLKVWTETLKNLSLVEPEFLELGFLCTFCAHGLSRINLSMTNTLATASNTAQQWNTQGWTSVKHHELPGKRNATPKPPGFHRNWIISATSAEQNPVGDAAGVNSEVWNPHKFVQIQINCTDTQKSHYFLPFWIGGDSFFRLRQPTFHTPTISTFGKLWHV